MASEMNRSATLKVLTAVLEGPGLSRLANGNYLPTFRRGVVRLSAFFRLSEPTDGSTAFLSNVINYLPVYTAQRLRGLTVDVTTTVTDIYKPL
jgi:hypothetical protein